MPRLKFVQYAGRKGMSRRSDWSNRASGRCQSMSELRDDSGRRRTWVSCGWLMRAIRGVQASRQGAGDGANFSLLEYPTGARGRTPDKLQVKANAEESRLRRYRQKRRLFLQVA